MTQIYTTYPEAWKTMLEDCKAAKSYIYFEQFILQDIGGGKGLQFLDVFKEKARQGVKVKVLVDAIGSIALASNVWWQKGIKEAGIELEIFGIVPRWKALFPFSLFHRDHRKLIIIDDVIAHVSGVIVGDRAKDWADIGVRLTDFSYIKEVKGAFLRLWDEVRGREEHLREYDVATNLILKNDPENNDLYAELLHRVRRAQHKISIVSPYFSPDWKMVRALKRARRRGIFVEVILPENCDSWITASVSQSYLRQLFRYGINVHHFKSCMNHGKMVVVDDWVTIGSMNFDRLSFFYNRELNVNFDKDIGRFESLVDDLKSCSTELDKGYFKEKGLWFAAMSVVGKLLRPIA